VRRIKKKDQIKKQPKGYQLIRDVLTDDRVGNLISKIVSVYSKIPKTRGCLESINEEKGCAAWCCRFQSPQVLYCEFLNTWRYVLRFWKTNDVLSIVEKSLQNYLTSNITKGCVFFDREKRMCKQHLTRPYNCRTYGITPPEEFNPKMQKLRHAYRDDPLVVLKDQCPLVKTEDGSAITTKDTDLWWRRLRSIERKIVPDDSINDGPDGSYRAYHDHILLHIFHPQTLMDLTEVRLHGDDKDKEEAIEFLMKELKQHIVSQMKDKNHGKTGHECECECECGGSEAGECPGNGTDCECNSSSNA